MSERIDLLKLEVFIAKDRPKEALEFFNGHQKLLKKIMA